MVLSPAALSTDGMQEWDPQPLIQLQDFLAQHIPVSAECSLSWDFNLSEHRGLLSEPTATSKPSTSSL